MKKPKDYFALDGEVFSLKRFFIEFTGKSDGYVIDIDEDKVTFIDIKERNIDLYRVIKIDPETLIEDSSIFLSQIPAIDKLKTVMFCGKHRNFTKIFNFLKSNINVENYFIPTVCKPEEVAAYGAALKGFLEGDYLSFSDNFLSSEESKLLQQLIVLTVGFYLIFYIFTGYIMDSMMKSIKRDQIVLFKKAFPDQPIVSVYDQVKSTIKPSASFKLSKLFLSVNLPKNAKIYKIEYINGVLTVKGESDEPPEVAKSIKKTPLGKFEFEVEVK
ncbi:MAG: hypothetical protein N2Z81_07300 [Hydrogenothermaceae bacterium]|nr:hypothetical protein [Hydrogenothermaceae bacterium]